MDHTDFFQEYQDKKKSSDKLFESISSKISMNKSKVDEGLFGLFGKKKKADDEKDPHEVNLEFEPEEEKVAQTDQATEKKEEQPAEEKEEKPTNFTLIKTKQGYQFGGPERTVAKITMPANSVYENYDWASSPLKSLFSPGLKFVANTMAFDLDRGVLLNFNGSWNGPFVGKTFAGVYAGNSFQGNFVGDDNNFKAQPTAFVDGTYIDTTKTGILGLDNVVNISETAKFNLIQVPVGYSIEILTNKQLRHTITVSKRLDNIDSNFQYTVFMGYDLDSSPNNITIPWSKIRQKFDAYFVSLKTKSIPDLLALQSDEKIIEIIILKAGTPPMFKKKIAFNPKKEYSEDSSKLVGLNSLLGGKRYGFGFKLNDDQDFENFNKMKGYVNSPVFMQDLNSISTFLDNKIITQNDLSKFNYLSKILTPEVLSEADFLGRKGGKERMSVSPRGISSTSNVPKDQVTGRPLKSAADIATYLSRKYEKDLKAGKQDKYNKEYNELYNSIVLKKAPSGKITPQQTATVSGAQSQPKESDSVLRRLDNFVKNFVYKIDMGEQTNQWRAFILDIIKKRIQQHKPKAKPKAKPKEQGQEGSVESSPAESPRPGSDSDKTQFGRGGFKKEAFIRLKIREVLREFM